MLGWRYTSGSSRLTSVTHRDKLRSMRFDLTTLSLQRFALEHLGNDCAVALGRTTNTWAVVDILAPHCERITVSNPLRT